MAHPFPCAPRYPALYQINTRVWLTALSRVMKCFATLDDIPEAELDRIAALGFDWVWLLSVWRTGAAGQRISREHPAWRHEFAQTLPDLDEEDVGGSGFAITHYAVDPRIGGDPALARLRERLRNRGLRLMLDFVPNHTAVDHRWVDEYPDYFVRGNDADLIREPQNFLELQTKSGAHVFAHGRDPYFSGWPDTLQLDYANPATQSAMCAELVKIAGQCDGVRCDMAMLLLPDVFERTWGRKVDLFWPRAIELARKVTPDFVFLAEVYWDLEWTLQQQGFAYTYDKRLYDRLRQADASSIRHHLQADAGYQGKMVRFLENHDEPRAAVSFSRQSHAAAAVITYLSPGLRFFHEGQLEGRKSRISPHLVRAPQEPVDQVLTAFYKTLLDVLRLPVVRHGDWQLLHCTKAWDANESFDAFIAFCWHAAPERRLLVAVNYGAHQSQCYVQIPFTDLAGAMWRFEDLLGEAVYDRDGAELQSKGLYLDVPPWQAHIFSIRAV